MPKYKQKTHDGKSVCWTCEWIAEYEWVCCCADSEYKADNPPMYSERFRCENHKPKWTIAQRA